MTSVRVYLGIGSNINPQTRVAQVLGLLSQTFGELGCSPRYQTRALGFDGPDFINMVVCFQTEAALPQLAQQLKALEQACGRDRLAETGKGSRTMDLDLLLYGDLAGRVEGYELPRPEIFERQFVWQPLLELLELLPDTTPFEHQLQAQLRKKLHQSTRLQPIAAAEAVNP